MGAFFEPGQVVDNCYKVVKLLGEGGYAQVFHVEEPRSKKQFALKVVDLGMPAGSERKDLIRVARQEVTALDCLRLRRGEAPSHCIDLVDEFDEGDYDCIVLPLLGVDLHTLRKNSSTRMVGMSLLKPMMKALCTAVAHVHSRGIAHLDLKLENVVLTNRGIKTMEDLTPENCDVTLIDFGLSIFSEDEDDVCNITRTYQPPENLVPDYKSYQESDVWSLAILLLCLHSGKLALPFRDEDLDDPEMLDQIQLASIECLLGERIPHVKDEARRMLERKFSKRYCKDLNVSMSFLCSPS